jgi:excisionase family DNA binding protein
MTSQALWGRSDPFIIQLMSDTARDYQTFQPIATEGLEEIFEVRELDASQDANQMSDGSSVREQDANMLSVEEAAERLGVSIRAVQKRLKKGTLTGRKEKTIHGERWLIDVRELDASQDANRMSDGSSVREQDANPVRLNANLDEDRDGLIKEMQAKIEALTWRNGYLESQLENQREHIKLLTDSQHQPSRWAGFKKWFLGQ